MKKTPLAFLQLEVKFGDKIIINSPTSVYHGKVAKIKAADMQNGVWVFHTNLREKPFPVEMFNGGQLVRG